MRLFLLTLAVFAVVLAGMSVGVIFGNRRIRGSCGGASQVGGRHGDISCDACSSDGQHCGSGDVGQETKNL